MLPTLSPELKQAQQLADTAQVFAVIALVVIVTTIAFDGGVPIGVALFDDTLDWREKTNRVGLLMVALLPALLFYEAVNRLRLALQHYDRGEFFSTEASARVAQAGDFAIEAMVAVILVVPNVTMWITHRGGFDMELEPATIGMLAFACFVAAVGRILTAATQLKAENDAFV
ncbi:MAG: DUF2975 domain-containing protein [Gammaproteobacteria bacterium]|nr:DUF2975 domain-containing protein [Gammaproteobacteria bacterium]